MREWFQFIEIRPINEFLDFIGPPREPSADTSQTIKGEVSLVLIKPVKIKSMIVKLKGSSTAYHPRTPDRCEIVSPILPKLKKSLFSNKSTLLPAGKHILPWELDVPNIYPRSMQIKRGSISYKVEISISLGINKKNIVEEYPITIRRHLLPSKELAPLVSVKTYKNTVPTKFHYEIEAPRIVCVEQNHFPASIKCMSIGNQKKVKSIRTQLIQVEIYRNKAASKAEADMTAMACRKKSIIGNHFSDLVKQGDPGITKYAKRIQPFTIHHVNSDFDTKIEPLLISHQLSNILIPGIESPLASIYHQLEVTFNFGHKYDEVKAKIPFLVSTVPYSSKLADIAFDRELAPRYSIETQAHQLPIYVDVQNNPKDKKSERRNTVLTETYYQSQSDECLSLRPSLSDNQLRSSSSYDSFEFGNPRKAVNGPKQKLLHPIDVELANRLLLNTSNRSSPFSQQSNQQNIPKKNARHSLAGLAPPPRSGRIREAIPEPKAPVNDSLSSFEDDMGSVYSDVSLGSRIAPSLTSSGTDSSGLLSLHSRPVSPPANVAPGLPATVTLRPQDDNHASLIEERFAAVNSTDPNSLSSPIQTVASSSVFTPRTTYAMMCQYYSNLQVPDRPQSMSSSTLNSPPGTENSSLFFYSNHIMAETHFTPLNANQYVSAELPPLPTEFAAGEEPAITRQNLPPIPGVSPTTTAFTDNTNNTHAYYRDESDEEEEEEEGGSISLSVSSPQLPQLPQLPEAAMPPQLPRLSLGHTFAFSLE